MCRSKAKPLVGMQADQVSADSERVRAGPATASRTPLPSRPVRKAATSPLKTTASASSRKSLAQYTARTAPPCTSMRWQAVLKWNCTPRACAKVCRFWTSAYMPPRMAQTPSISTCAISISVAGASQGEEPQ